MFIGKTEKDKKGKRFQKQISKPQWDLTKQKTKTQMPDNSFISSAKLKTFSLYRDQTSSPLLLPIRHKTSLVHLISLMQIESLNRFALPFFSRYLHDLMPSYTDFAIQFLDFTASIFDTINLRLARFSGFRA